MNEPLRDSRQKLFSCAVAALSKSGKSQSVSYFTVPPRAHPSTGSQSGSATPGLTQVPSTRSRGLLNCRKLWQVSRSKRKPSKLCKGTCVFRLTSLLACLKSRRARQLNSTQDVF